MKYILFTFVLLISSTSILFSQDKIQEFMPDVVKEFPNVRDITISKDGTEIYFTIESYKKEISAIVFLRQINSGWSPPEIVSFSGKYRDIEPTLSPDGRKLYFSSNRPISKEENKPKDYDIWVVERDTKNSEWQAPKNLGQPVNSKNDEFYPSITTSGNLYFTAQLTNTKGKEDIYVCTYTNGEFVPPVSLDSAINTATYEFNAYVAPDESFIIFSSYRRKDGLGGSDLYISVKENENWQEAVHLDEPINSKSLDYCPFIDLQNNRFYFTSERSSIPTYFASKIRINEFLQTIKQSPNGQSRIYYIESDNIIKKLSLR